MNVTEIPDIDELDDAALSPWVAAECPSAERRNAPEVRGAVRSWLSERVARDAHHLGLRDGEQWHGFALLERLDHESRYFGMECGRLRLTDMSVSEDGGALIVRNVLDHARERSLRCIWVQCASAALVGPWRRVGFRAAHAMVNWHADPTVLTCSCSLARDREITTGERDALIELTGKSMRHHRYGHDTRFPPERIEALYRAVAKGCIDGDLAASTHYLRDARGQLVGMVALSWWHDPDLRIGHYRFLIRHPDAPQDTVASLLHVGRDWFHEHGARALVSQTSTSNRGMIRQALEVGFEHVGEVQDHFWWAP